MFLSIKRKLSHHNKNIIIILLVSIGLILTLNPKQALAATCNVSSSAGIETSSINIPYTGTYNIWVLMQTPNASNSALQVQIDQNNCWNMGGGSTIPSNTWKWVNYQNGNVNSLAQSNLSLGSHTVKIIGTGGVLFTKALFLTNSSCIPSGDGNNCEVTTIPPPTISITSPQNNSVVNGNSVNLAAIATSIQSISKVQYLLDGTVIGTTTTTPYSINWNSLSVANGSHQLTAIATDASNQTSVTSENITVNNVLSCNSSPSAPSSLAVTNASPSSISIHWNTPSSTGGNSCSLKDYQIYRNGALVGTVTTNSYVDSGLSSQTTYSYKVVAVNSGQNASAASSSISGTTTNSVSNTSVPNAPTNVNATLISSNSQIQLNWSASSSNANTIKLYNIYRNGNLYKTISSSTTSYIDSNITAGQAYNYQVSAVGLNGLESSLTSAQTVISVPTVSHTTTNSLPTPSGLSTSLITANVVTLSWNRPNTSSILGYHVYRNGQNIGNALNSTNSFDNGNTVTVSYTDTSVSPSQQYSYYVVAFGTNGALSSQSSNINVQTLAGSTVFQQDPILGSNNSTGKVDIYDLSVLLGHWNDKNASIRDGNVLNSPEIGIYDLSALLSNWGNNWKNWK